MTAKPHHHRLARSAGIFTSATLLSRILGYVRDTMVANFFGAGASADAFYVAFRISNLLRRLLGEGALSVSFIPVFTEYLEKHGKEKTQEFLNTIFTSLLVLLTVITLLGVVFAPQITQLTAWGFERTPERFALTVTLTRYMFPFLLFISLAALITGVLNAFESFFLPALAPACLSVAEIGYVLAIAPFVTSTSQIIGLAISVTVGGFSQFFIHVPALWQKGYRLSWRWNPGHPGVRRVVKLMLPATLGTAADQLNAFIDTNFASFLAVGSNTALYYSNRVMQLPLALFGIALSQVALPSMSASVARGKIDEVKETLNFALRLTLFMILPATTGLLVLGHPIIRVLFEHGRFTPEATLMTNHALFYFSLGLFAYASVKILASAFYAFQETRIPVKVAMSCIAINILLNIYFIKFTTMGVGGLALSTATASWFNALTLYWLLKKKLGFLGGRKLAVTFFKSLISSAAMALVSYGWIHWIPLPLVINLAAAILIGCIVYFGMAWTLRMEEWGPFWAQILHRAVPSAVENIPE